MNRRQLKKYKKQSRVSKKLLKMVARYSSTHYSVDMCRGIYGVCYVSAGKSDFDYQFIPEMSLKSYQKIENLCKQLFYETNRITNPGEKLEWGIDKQYNYRIVKKAFGHYCACFDFDEVEIMGYYVDQQTIIEDYYRGTVYLPLNNGKFLAYDYEE